MANKVALVALILSSVVTVYSQVLPQIVVTDSDGITHDLYADYLDQEMSLLIGIFFSSCAPCQTIAEELEVLYQEWGAGGHEVQFIQLSSESWETDATVETYKMAFGTTNPVVSAEGGSVEAVQALIDAEFGDFNGAPLYLVVAPDGSVQWDVFGFGEEATINAIDEALEATGAGKPTTATLPLSEAISVRLSPNPATTAIHLSWDTPLRRPWVVVHSEQSATVFHRSVDASLRAFRIPVMHWPAGTYTLQLLEGSTIVKSIRFIKF